MPSLAPPLANLGAALLAAVCCAACFKFKVEQHVTPGISSLLLGEWQGQWASSTSNGSGTVTLGLQTFETHPIVRLDATHPCLQTQTYAFVQQGLHWELQSNGQVVFAATLDPAARTLSGEYQCTVDRGTWSARWDHELPAIGDVSGTWSGTFASTAPALQGNFALDLAQHWQNGRLAVTGTLQVEALGIEVPIADGAVDWRSDRFDLTLRTDRTPGPAVWLQGTSAGQGLEVHDGVLLVDDPRLPFRFGVWSATWIGP